MNAPDLSAFRSAMVDSQVAGRGVRSHLVLNALREVAREDFVPAPIREFAYEDAELPLADGRTIPRPCTVGTTVEALGLEGGENASPHAGSIWAGRGPADAASDAALATAIVACAEKFATPGTADLEALLRRIGL